MPTPEEIVKQAEEQEAEAKRKAEHQVQDLRKLNTNVDPDAEAESTEEYTDPATEAALEAKEADAFDVNTAKKADLVAEAERRGVDSSGTADDLRERLGG